MSIQIGDINVPNEIIELHFQILRTQLVLDLIIGRSNSIYKPTDQDVRQIEDRVIQILNQKFPNMGINRRT